MSKKIKVACATLNQTPFAWAENKKNILSAISKAKSEGVQILLLPEMCITGYGCEDAFLGRDFAARAQKVLLEIVPETKGIVVSLGLPVFLDEEFSFNTSCLLVDGKIAGFVAKQALPIHGVHYETRWFTEAKPGGFRQIEVAGSKYPFGDLIFSLDGFYLGYEICREAWICDRPLKRLSKNGVSILLNPSASHFAFSRHQSRKELLRTSADTYGVHYLYVNLLGNEAGSIIYDGCAFIASPNKPLVSGKRFSFKNYVLTPSVIELVEKKPQQAHPNVICSEFRFIETQEAPAPLVEEAWEQSSHLKEEEFARAVSLGLFDYLRKSKLQGFVLSLSGGADSSCVACLVHLMLSLTLSELGAAGLRDKLPHIKSLAEKNSAEEMLGEILSCLYQATRNNSEQTLLAAELVAKSLGASFAKIEIDALVEAYCELAESLVSRKLSWEQDATALQNVQARVRAPSAWFLANLKNALLLCTSNRSEASVGYATMDGDTAGGLSPIAGVDKTFILGFLSLLEKQGLSGIAPYSFLSAVTSLAPSAELRPLLDGQTDEKDLMPYALLNAIESLLVGKKLSLKKALVSLERDFSQVYSKEFLRESLIKFVRLFSASQWKRERLAPSFFLDERSLDPRTWHRFPVLSGGYVEELEEL